jgi:hypothetical protein
MMSQSKYTKAVQSHSASFAGNAFTVRVASLRCAPQKIKAGLTPPTYSEYKKRNLLDGESNPGLPRLFLKGDKRKS